MSMTIRDARHLCRYTLAEVSEGIGVTPTTLCRWELGETTPNLRQYVDLCKFYEVEPGTLKLPEQKPKKKEG